MTSICFITYEYPPQIGGEAAYTSGLASALNDMGNDITVITTTSGKSMDISKEGDIRVIRLPKSRVLPKMLSFSIDARKILENGAPGKIDIIHNTSDYNGIIIPGNKKKTPVIATIHHPYAEERRIYRASTSNIEYFKYAIHRKIDYLEYNSKLLCRKSDRLIAVSNYTAKSVTAEYGIQPDKLSIIPNAVDINRFNPDIDGTEIRKKLGIAAEKVILFVGRLDFQKGIEYLISAFSKIVKEFPEAKLIVVGDGPLKNNVRAAINESGLSKSVFLMGRTDTDDLPKIYAACDLFVVPSLMEGFGIVYLEAMASGKACIGANIGGVEDAIVDGHTGLLVPPADSDSIYCAIKKLLSDEDTLARFGKEGRKRVLENFTWKKVAAQTLEVYNKASGSV
ncbi:glycosyltransferase family 4 protein [Candidatus Methanoperedens nitratireducens]|uniref:Putative enzyme n=1 Tax=Candidatus Methanoperedens nitratireducens TaxID=1392998 RepID=A0A284VS57_9EURY|nr:glycosyltransferase family 4 protein [Candidatus Methanoperedens nitroreducens]SNQ62115.1 putative enzyme [Candidatus Methanoperedens nitroreducens]